MASGRFLTRQARFALLRSRRAPFSSSHKEIKFGDEGRAAMARGVNILANAVATTLGPKGRTVIIEQPFGGPKITKDGVTVAKSITLADKFENLGANVVQNVASKTNEAAGDGTTTATILARAIFTEGLKCIASGVNPAELRRGVNRAVNEVIDFLKANVTRVTSTEQISQVATISANGDTQIGKMIADAISKVGKDGVITILEGKTFRDELEVTEGMKFDRGFISPYFVNDTKKQEVSLEDPMILITDRKVTLVNDVIPCLELAAREKRPLVIIAEDVDGEALAALILNKLRGHIAVCAVKAPGFGDHRRAVLEDLAILTGGQLVNEQIGMKLDKPDRSWFGNVKHCTVTKDSTLILNGRGAQSDVNLRCEFLRKSMEETKSEYEREKLHERLAKLSSGVSIIKVGGVSEVEMNERKDRFVDALAATKAAIEEGIIPGGGSALIKAVSKLQELATKEKNNDVRLGIKIVTEAIQAPLITIVENAGEHGAVVAGEIKKNATDFAFGYNAATGKYVNMIQEGIVDPLKVVRTALSDACGVASLLTTTEAMIVDSPKPVARNPPGMNGMSPDMDY